MELTKDELMTINGGKISFITIVEAVYTLYGIVKYIVKRVRR